ncbi:hypothetical protein Taro_049398 [Colocasia esculenta]|uniref:Uncharacterized protein n=1 Tax=Colocasia esculenta TaxID=4460 RepID=A0A843XAU4_COLES|nr:hypothetical protein [Colocasia esculenta]
MGVTGVRVQPARRPCGNPWIEETYGGLDQKLTSLADGVSNGEFIQVKREEGFMQKEPRSRPTLVRVVTGSTEIATGACTGRDRLSLVGQ